MDVNEMINARIVHEIHTSERKSFRACRRRWDWVFRERWYPHMTAKPLEFGTAYHAAMEAWYDPQFWDSDRTMIAKWAIQVFVDHCEKQRQNFLRQTQVPYLEEEVQADYNERIELGKGMLNYYFSEVSPKEDANWRPVKVEIEFFVPIPNPETGEEYIFCKCDQCWERWVNYHPELTEDGTWNQVDYRHTWQGAPVVYAGRLDALMEDESGNYWVADWKTAARISDRYEFLFLDDQVGSYVWALWKLGIRVKGFIYHEQKKAYPKPPKKNKNIRLGRMFSVSKQQDTDYDSFVKTIREEDAAAYEAGLYSEYLDFLLLERTPFYFRYQIHKSAQELEEIERNIGYEALDMIDPGLRVYPSPGRFGCGSCAFLEPCKEKNAQGDYMYLLENLFERREHYYMRQEPSTESKGAE